MTTDVLAPSGAPEAPGASVPLESPSSQPAEGGQLPASESPPNSGQPPEESYSPGAQQRINELTARMRTAERIAAALIRRDEESGRQPPQPDPYAGQRGQQPAGQSQPIDPNTVEQVIPGDFPPDQAKYDDWGKYTLAVTAWANRQIRAREQVDAYVQQRETNEQQAINRARTAVATFEASLQTQIEQGAAQYPDFQQVVSNPNIPNFRQAHPALQEAIVYSEKPAALIYALAKDPQFCHKLVGMHPTAAIRELGRFEARMAPIQGVTSDAPAPVGSVSGRSSGPDPLSDKVAIDQWIANRNKQVAAQNRRK